MSILIWILTSAIASATPVFPIVVSLKGDVKVLTNTGENLPSMLYEGNRYFYRKARIGMQIDEGSVVLCAPDARIKLVYNSGTSLWLGPGTMMKIVRVESAAVGENSTLDLVYGKLRSLVYKSKDAQWQVRTPSAVDGVRGTDFVSSYSALGGHQVTVISGVVEVKPTAHPNEKRDVKADQAARETAEGKITVEPISKVQVLSAYELTAIPSPAKEEKAKVVELETKSRALLVRELPHDAKAMEAMSDADLNRKVIDAHLQKAKGETKLSPFSHDLNNYKKMDEGQ